MTQKYLFFFSRENPLHITNIYSIPKDFQAIPYPFIHPDFLHT